MRLEYCKGCEYKTARYTHVVRADGAEVDMPHNWCERYMERCGEVKQCKVRAARERANRMRYEKELSAAEVRALPEHSKVTIIGRDVYGYTTRCDTRVRIIGGMKVLVPENPYVEGNIGIRERKGKKYVVEEVEGRK